MSAPAAVAAFNTTAAHQAIFDWVQNLRPATRAALIEAVAGSGKTSTLIQILRLIPRGQSVIFLAFGKDAAREVEQRAQAAGLCRPGVAFKTLNGLGYGPLRRQFGSDVDTDTVDNRLAERLTPEEYQL